jgi:hypothetical protein
MGRVEEARFLDHQALRIANRMHQHPMEIALALGHDLARLFVGVGDAGIVAEQDVIRPRIEAVGARGLLVDIDAALRDVQVRDQRHAHHGAVLAGELGGFLIARRHQDRRVGPLKRLRPDRDGWILIELALPAERLRLGPAFDDQRSRFAQPLARFVRHDVVGDVFVRHAADHPGDQPPAAHHVDHGVFFRHPDRIEQWNEIAEHRELDR